MYDIPLNVYVLHTHSKEYRTSNNENNDKNTIFVWE